MKKFLLGAAAATLLFAGCAQNELLDGGVATPNDGKIYFSATSGVPTNTRALPINSTGDLQKINSFYVAGYQGTTQIVGAGDNGQKVDWNGVSWEYPNEPYWPSTGTMNFLAYANWGTAPTISSTEITATRIIAADANGTTQSDLLVAATYGAQKETRTLLTFKHALTQIVFKAGNWSPEAGADALNVIIGGVKLVNVSDKGTMKVSAAADNKAQIVWNGIDDQTGRRAEYSVAHIGPTSAANPSNGYVVERIAGADKTNYSKYPRIQSAAEDANNALMLVPQNFVAWNPLNADLASAQNGTYIEISAIIHKVGATTQAEWYCGTYNADLAQAAYGKIYIPVSSLANEVGQWQPGKRINYIITFGDKESGSSGGGFDNNGDPILVPIRFRATVEDWVEANVPLLTAQFEAKSSTITNRFITGYINQLLTDVKSSPSPKVFNGSVKIDGSVSLNINNTTYDDLNLSEVTNGGAASHQFLSPVLHTNEPISSKFLPGSTVTYDLTKVSADATGVKFNGTTLTLKVPEGWVARTYLGTTPVNPNAPETASILANQSVIMSEAADKIVLTKVATTGYDYYPHIGYIESNIAAIELNENYCATIVPNFDRKVVANDEIPVPAGILGTTSYYFNFSCDMLSKFNSAFVGAKVTLDLTAVEGWATTTGQERGVRTWVPAGWKAEVGGNTYYGGDVITLTAANTIILIKIAGGLDHAYHSVGLLTDWLTNTNTKGNGETFYYNNVDFDVAINLGSSPWNTIAGVTTTNTAVVKLKYPLSTGKVTLATNWAYDDATGTLTYTAP